MNRRGKSETGLSIFRFCSEKLIAIALPFWCKINEPFHDVAELFNLRQLNNFAAFFSIRKMWIADIHFQSLRIFRIILGFSRHHIKFANHFHSSIGNIICHRFSQFLLWLRINKYFYDTFKARLEWISLKANIPSSIHHSIFKS